MIEARSISLRLRSRRPARRGLAGLCLVTLGLYGCGGGGNPLGNPPLIDNPASTTGKKLSFAYFQKCINPIFLAQLQININGQVSVNTCAGSGCHDNANGTGGALRVVPAAKPLDVTDPANTAEVIRASDIYKNFYSAQASTDVGAPAQSRLLIKPLLQGVLHGGGLIFTNDQDPNVKLIRYWISRPAPQGQDEFSTATYSMFTPADPKVGTCNTD